AIARSANGNPMVLELLVQDWISNKRNCLALSVRAFTTDLHTPPQKDGRLDHIVSRLLSELNPKHRRVLFIAAVLDQRLNDLAMYEVAGLPINETLDAFATLNEQRVIRDTG